MARMAAEWRNGKNGGMAEWQNDKNGGMAELRPNGGMAIWEMVQ